jgi:hypothetical protein
MRLDTTKIDARINRLQELKRLLSDSEMTNVVLECLVNNESDGQKPAAPPISRISETSEYSPDMSDGVEKVMSEVLEGTRWGKREFKSR